MTGVIVHEWLAPIGGSEQVVEALADIFPDAPVYCLWDDAPGRFASGRVHETWLARTPLRRSKVAAMPLMPATWRHLPAEDADWVLASSHLFAHHARFAGAARSAPKYCYVHTPARYIWVPELDGRGNGGAQRAASAVLKRLDRRRAQEAVAIAANSAFVRDRIAMAWGRDSVVIHPPVDVEFFASSDSGLTDDEHRLLAELPESFLLGASRLVPYKRVDVAIAAGHASDLPVVVVGRGPDESRLRAIAESGRTPVHFLGRTSRPMMRELFRRTAAFVFTAVEDFGIIPVEAMAAGAPVIASRVGGVGESVVDGRTGVLLERFDAPDLRAAVDAASRLDRGNVRARAQDFSAERFAREISSWLPS